MSLIEGNRIAPDVRFLRAHSNLQVNPPHESTVKSQTKESKPESKYLDENRASILAKQILLSIPLIVRSAFYIPVVPFIILTLGQWKVLTENIFTKRISMLFDLIFHRHTHSVAQLRWVENAKVAKVENEKTISRLFLTGFLSPGRGYSKLKPGAALKDKARIFFEQRAKEDNTESSKRI